MYKEHYTYHTPKDNIIIWRYMSFKKFKDFIESGMLFFCRSDKFADKEEGTLNVRDYAKFQNFFSAMEATKKFYFINCWHMNEVEEQRMWDEYTNGEGVAIKSSVKRFKDSISNYEEDIILTEVQYIEFEKVTYRDLWSAPENQIFDGLGSSVSQFNYKSKKYEFEREMRACFIDLPIPHTIKNGVPREPLELKRVKVDMKELIDKIVISPSSTDRFKISVEELIENNKLGFDVSKSFLFK